MEERIRRYCSAAAFTEEDPSQPVSWAMQYHNGMIGALYTSEAHRRKGLGLAVTASLCRSILEYSPSIPPYTDIDGDAVASSNLFEKLGFVLSPFPSTVHYFDIKL